MSLPTISNNPSVHFTQQLTTSRSSEHNDQGSVLDHRNTSINGNTYQLRRATSAPSLKIIDNNDQSTTKRTFLEFFDESIASIESVWKRGTGELIIKVKKTADMLKNDFSKLQDYHFSAQQEMFELNTQCLEIFAKLSPIDERSEFDAVQLDYRVQLQKLTAYATTLLASVHSILLHQNIFPDDSTAKVPELAKLKQSLEENKQAIEALNELTLSSVEKTDILKQDWINLENIKSQLDSNNECQTPVKIRENISKLESTVSQKKEKNQAFEKDQNSLLKTVHEELARLNSKTDEYYRTLQGTLKKSKYLMLT